MGDEECEQLRLVDEPEQLRLDWGVTDDTPEEVDADTPSE